MRTRLIAATIIAAAVAVAAADEGMWRLDQLPLDAIQKAYGVRLTPADLARVQAAVVRISSGGTGTFASANGLILTNHHVALDCIRTSTLAEQAEGNADNLIETGFTAASMKDELPCKRFRAQVEVSASDVTARVNAGITATTPIADVQRMRQAARSDIERACATERGDDFTCAVTDFNSGARSLLIVYEDFKDIRLVYAPEKQLGYFGGDEMNFRFPRYVSDISILRAYVAPNGAHTEYAAANVAAKPAHFLPVSMTGVSEGDFTLVAGNPGNTNRYRMSFSADYNVRKGMPEQIQDFKALLALYRKYAAMKPEYQVLLQEQIFGLANTLKYSEDLLASLKATNVVAAREQREREFAAFLETKPDLAAEYGGVLEAQRAVYANDVEANADLDAALGWLQQASVVGYAAGLYEFAQERAKTSDREREPQFQERNWPQVRQALLVDDPLIEGLEVELLTRGLERALTLTGEARIPAVTALAARVGPGATAEALARAVIQESALASVEARKKLIDAPVGEIASSSDAALMFARDLLPSIKAARQRVRVLNEKLFQNRSRFARGLAAWRGQAMYPDANFTLRGSYGKVAGYTDRRGRPVPFTTYFKDLFALAASRGDTGEFALPAKLKTWRQRVGDQAFASRYADLPVDFVSTNDITGGNSGSATLNRRLEIVGLIFDGNEEGMAGDWIYDETAGRALSTDIRFALTVAREVHGAGWIVDELLAAAKARTARIAPVQF